MHSIYDSKALFGKRARTTVSPQWLQQAFRIYLPRLDKITSHNPTQSFLAPTRAGNETILLVEDDPYS
jgi:hypothetical protein